ncbi:hypothetical protein MFLO_06504 [Listeria floridensis FSL S10-1187]|uniref:DUF1934 domain-containing protein n=1 Tax=Listeria floridensis FSL S10-1187 TaxID=1265817 RepID=A0ABN0RG23_9LIST|nr:DUF1934 family protein [Listeria floridensis]EUJ32736.1 hypothetical protein MFLO_06504 [Listeria floridensis FSL S10-1187]
MAKERKTVQIQITNLIRQMDALEKTEMTVPGVFYRDAGNIYLHYEEKQVAGNIRSVLKISEKELLLLRSGAVNMRLHFFKDRKRSTASVDSGAGKLVFESELVGYNETFQEEAEVRGEVAFQYDLLSAGTYIGSYEVTMRIEEAPDEFS